MRMLTTFLFCLGPKGWMIQHERFVGTALHQTLSSAEFELQQCYNILLKYYTMYRENAPRRPFYFRGLWCAHRAVDTLVTTFQTLIDSIEDPDEKDWVLCEYQPRVEQLKREFSDNLESRRLEASGGNHPLGVPRANHSVLYYSFSPESTIKERLEEFDFLYVRADAERDAWLSDVHTKSNRYSWCMGDIQRACKDTEEAFQALLDSIDDPEEENRIRDKYDFTWLVEYVARQREGFPWHEKSSSNFRMELIKEKLPKKYPWVVEQFPWKDPGPL